MNSMEDKAKIANKVRALLAKTTDKGCTEAEAMAAAIKAKALMDEYQINLSEFDLESEGFIRGKAEKAQPYRFNVQDYLAGAIGAFTDCKVWCTFAASGLRRSDKRQVFFGLKSDVEFANWLLVALECFVWQNANEFETEHRIKFGPTAGGYYLKRDFARGCVARINERLREAVKSRTPAVMGDGRALVVVKHALVEREFNKLGMTLGKASARTFNRGNAPPDAYSAGRAAGDRASFGRPVAGKGETLKLR
jgi:hypothetical protein